MKKKLFAVILLSSAIMTTVLGCGKEAEGTIDNEKKTEIEAKIEESNIVGIVGFDAGENGTLIINGKDTGEGYIHYPAISELLIEDIFLVNDVESIEPVNGDLKFEGWIKTTGTAPSTIGGGYDIPTDDTLYTTEEILTHACDGGADAYLAKWEGVSIDSYFEEDEEIDLGEYFDSEDVEEEN